LRLPFFMPGVPAGHEEAEILLLEATIATLRRLSRGEVPDPETLVAAPVIGSWAPMTDPGNCRLRGVAGGASGAVIVTTARVVAVAYSGAWALTTTGIWRLGSPITRD
jgi:hypothetical protein